MPAAQRPHLPFALLLALGLSLCAWALGLALPSLAAYLAFLAACVVAPGLALQRLARVAIEPALVLPLGAAFCAGAQAASLCAGQRWPLAALTLALLAAAATVREPWRRAAGPALRGALAPLALLVALFALTQYGGFRVAPDGDFLLDPLVTSDSTFHAGLSRELTLGWPPQVPGLAGFPLGYHLGLDLVRAAALTWAGTDPFDQLARLDLTWAALALVLALRGMAFRLGLRGAALTLAGFTPLLTDFAWVFAGSPQAHWWSDLLRGNLLLSLFLANPSVLALALCLAALLALDRHAAGEGRGCVVLAALAGAALPQFKVFLGAHLLLGLGLAWLLRRLPWRVALAVVLPTGLSTALLSLGQGGRSVELAFEPLGLVRDTRATLGLDPLAGGPFLAFALVWLLASLGARVVALPAAVRALRASSPAAAALAAMALVGWPLGLLFRVSAPAVLPGEPVINDAAYLVEQSGPLLWLWACGALALGAGPTRRVVALVLLALSLPASVQFLWHKAGLPPDRMPAAQRQAVLALAARTAPGAVVLQRPSGRFPPAPVIFASRRVLYERYTPYLTQFAAPEALLARHERVARFFRTRDVAEARALAGELRADALCLFGSDRVRFPVEELFEPVFDTDGARCLVLRPTARPR